MRDLLYLRPYARNPKPEIETLKHETRNLNPKREIGTPKREIGTLKPGRMPAAQSQM